MTTLLQISDPHFGTEDRRVCEALAALAARLQPDAYIVSGDLTQRATRSQFAAAQAFLDTLPAAPKLVIPGNHDVPLFAVWARVVDPYGRYAERFGANLSPWMDVAGARLIGVNTARWWRQQHGAIADVQIERVVAHIRSADRGAWRIVVTHHPLRVVRDEDRGDRPLNFQRAIDRWVEAGADLVVGGHIHLPYVLPLHPSRDVGVAPGHGTWLVQAGTAVSTRTLPGVPNSVNVLAQSHDPQRGLVRSVTRWDFDPTPGEFIAVAHHVVGEHDAQGVLRAHPREVGRARPTTNDALD